MNTADAVLNYVRTEIREKIDPEAIIHYDDSAENHAIRFIDPADLLDWRKNGYYRFTKRSQ